MAFVRRVRLDMMLHPTPLLLPHRLANRGWIWIAVAALATLITLFWLRPASPFEWDEVLFLRALEHYDVARHSPHPPGYPVYMAVGWLMLQVCGDGLLALQLVSLLAAAAAAGACALVARELGGAREQVALAGGLFLVLPTSLFHANVGLSDMLGVAAATFAALTLCRAARHQGWWLVASAAASALAAGVRPQVVVVLLPAGLWALVSAVRARKWQWLGGAASAGVVTCVACWLPAVLLTGWSRYVGAFQSTSDYVVLREVKARLPLADPMRVLDDWLVHPFGPFCLALAVWVAVAVGSVTWWRRGHRALVWVCVSSGLGYLLVAAWTLNRTTSVRYALPALPFLCMLAAGALNWRPRRRRLGVLLLATIAIGSVSWMAPLLIERSREVAPVWAALQWLVDHPAASGASVQIPGSIRPHAREVLTAHGLTYQVAGADSDIPPVYSVETPVQHTGATAVFTRSWSGQRWRIMTRRRYLSAAVLELAEPALDHTGPWRLAGRGWRLDGPGTVAVVDGGPMLQVQIEVLSGRAALRRPQQALLELAEHEMVVLPLVPVQDGAVSIIPMGGQLELTTTVVRAEGAAAEDDWIVPAVTRSQSASGERWLSDLTLRNPRNAPTRVSVLLEPARQRAVLTVPAGGELNFPDVLATLFVSGGIGYLRLRGEVTVCSTLRHIGPWGSVSCPIEAVRPGEAIVAPRSGQIRVLSTGFQRCNLGVVNLSSAPVTVDVVALDAASHPLRTTRLRVLGREYHQVRHVFQALSLEPSAVHRIEIRPSHGAVLAHTSQISGSGATTITPAVLGPVTESCQSEGSGSGCNAIGHG